MTMLSTPDTHAARAPAPAFSLRAAAAALMSILAGWQNRTCSRRALGELDERMLRDIGISRSQLAYETGKSFWQR